MQGRVYLFWDAMNLKNLFFRDQMTTPFGEWLGLGGTKKKYVSMCILSLDLNFFFHTLTRWIHRVKYKKKSLFLCAANLNFDMIWLVHAPTNLPPRTSSKFNCMDAVGRTSRPRITTAMVCKCCRHRHEVLLLHMAL